VGKVIGILGLKGGVGKTTSAVSLGAALASFGKKVLIVDANFSAPNLGIHLNVLNPEKTIHHVLDGSCRPDDAVCNLDDFDIIPASLYPKKQFDPLKLKEKLRWLRRKYDFIILDSSPALNNETLAAMLASDDLFVVSTPDFSTLSMTIKAIAISKKRGAPINGIILNKLHNKDFELKLEEIEKTSEVPVLAAIPHDINVLKAQHQFIPPTFFAPKSSLSTEYKKLAACLSGEKYEESKIIKSLFKNFAPKKQEINRTLYYNSVF